MYIICGITHIHKTSIDVVGAVDPSDWLQAHPGGLVRQDVHQPVLELVHWQVCTHKLGWIGFDIREFLKR